MEQPLSGSQKLLCGQGFFPEMDIIHRGMYSSSQSGKLLLIQPPVRDQMEFFQHLHLPFYTAFRKIQKDRPLYQEAVRNISRNTG